MTRKEKEAWLKTLEIIKKRQPSKYLELSDLSDCNELSLDQINEILSILGDEFCAHGLKDDSEPNSYGLEIENLNDLFIRRRINLTSDNTT